MAAFLSSSNGEDVDVTAAIAPFTDPGLIVGMLIRFGVVDTLPEAGAWLAAQGVTFTSDEDGIHYTRASATALLKVVLNALHGAYLNTAPAMLDLSCSGASGESITFALPWVGPGVWSLGIPRPNPTADPLPEGSEFTFSVEGMKWPDGTPIEFDPGDDPSANPPVGFAMLGYYQFLVNAGEPPASCTLTVSVTTPDESPWELSWITAFQVQPNPIAQAQVVEP